MSASRTFVSVAVDFDGIHNWENAPHFLKHPHQHQFRVRLKVETIPGDNDRTLEFFEIKAVLRNAIEQAFRTRDSLGIRHLGGHSTESISDLIYNELPVSVKTRHIWIEVNEDETQGSESEYQPISTPPADQAVVLSVGELQAIVQKLGEQISRDYCEVPALTVVCLLKGAFVFAADLIRQIDHPGLEVEFMRPKSYNGTQRGVLKTLGPVPRVKGKHVLLLDDIYDSGETLKRAVELLEHGGAASLRVAVLLRRSRNTVPLNVHYCGFVLENDDFVSGYGLDVDEKERGLPFLRKAC